MYSTISPYLISRWPSWPPTTAWSWPTRAPPSPSPAGSPRHPTLEWWERDTQQLCCTVGSIENKWFTLFTFLLKIRLLHSISGHMALGFFWCNNFIGEENVSQTYSLCNSSGHGGASVTSHSSGLIHYSQPHTGLTSILCSFQHQKKVRPPIWNWAEYLIPHFF